MNIPKLKRDTTNTKIINSDEIINYITYDNDLNELTLYLKLLLQQTKVNKEEVSEIIKACEIRIDELNSFKNKYNLIKDDFDKLNDFYEENSECLLLYIREVFNKNYSHLDDIVHFFKYCLLRQQNGFQNKLRTQNVFNEFCDYYISNRDRFDQNLRHEFDNLIEEKNKLLDSVDESAMDYKEDNYLTRTQVLSLSPTTNKGYNLTEDDLKLNARAFVATTIILEVTLALALIIALIIIFK